MKFPEIRSDKLASLSKTRVEKIQPLLPKNEIYLLSPGDVHLGGRNRGEALYELLSNVECKILVLNGDFLDVDSLPLLLKRLNKSDRELIFLIEKKRLAGMHVVYLQGNHDENMSKLLSDVETLKQQGVFKEGSKEYEVLEALSLIENWQRQEIFEHEFRGATYVHAHGDQWDYLVRSPYFGKLLATVGAFLWEILKRIDGEKHKVAIFTKRRIKLWMKVSSHVASGAVALAKERGAQYAFAGHTHDLRESLHDGVSYINAGSFDMYESGLVTIDEEGKVVLHRVHARNRPISSMGIQIRSTTH